MPNSAIIVAMTMLIACTAGFAQHSFTPYPVIFVHGLASSDLPWLRSFATITKVYGDHVPSGGNDPGTVVHGMLNRYKSMTSMFGQDGIPYTDDDDVFVARTALSPGAVFAVNFHTSWNEEPSSPVLTPYDQHWILARESESNQSSIVKQGFALQRCIQLVLDATGAQKVILVGHSMGGLAIREYLQRCIGSRPRWWVDPESPSGHHVAKVVTIGTPHNGDDIVAWLPSSVAGLVQSTVSNQLGLGVPDLSSEAVRDLRRSYRLGSAHQGIYLFGGSEQKLNTSWLLDGWYNADVDCNGREADSITGITQALTSTLPLPLNVSYTWIVSTVAQLSSDILVDATTQLLQESGTIYPPNRADTLHAHHAHWNGMSDAYAIMRGLDEPDSLPDAYPIDIGRYYRGAITLQPNEQTEDVDVYRLLFSHQRSYAGGLRIVLRDTISTRRALTMSILNAKRDTLYHRAIGYGHISTVIIDSAAIDTLGNEMFIAIRARANASDWHSPYEFIVAPLGKVSLAPVISGLVDTTITHDDTLVDAFHVWYDAHNALQWAVTSSDTSVVPTGNIHITGNGATRELRATPAPFASGTSEIRVSFSDSLHSLAKTYRVHVEGWSASRSDATRIARNILVRPLTESNDAVSVSSTDISMQIYDVGVFDAAGRFISTASDDALSKPASSIRINTMSLPPGYYTLRIGTSFGLTYKLLQIFD